jgi:hypothetical protein
VQNRKFAGFILGFGIFGIIVGEFFYRLRVAAFPTSLPESFEGPRFIAFLFGCFFILWGSWWLLFPEKLEAREKNTVPSEVPPDIKYD